MTNKNKNKRNIRHELQVQISNNKVTFAVYIILRTIIVAAIIRSFISGNYENLFVCTLSLILFLIPAFIEKNFGIDIPNTLEVIILLFIFAAVFLGEMESYYVRVPYWDTMLHCVNGFLCAAIGFALVDILNRNERIKFRLSPFFLAIVAFCFSMTIGIIWEFFEFGCDILLRTDMQKDTIISSISSVTLDPTMTNKAVIIDGIRATTVNGNALNINGYLDIGLFDTMKDLFVNFIGATVFSVIGYFYVRHFGKGKFAKLFIPTLKKKQKQKNPDK